MNYTNLTKSSKIDNLRFINTKNPIILHIVPDFDSDVADNLFTCGIELINCLGIVSQSKNIKLGIKTFNTRRIFLNCKNKLENKEVTNATKSIQVFQDYPKDLNNHLINNKQFIIVDHTVLSQASNYIVKQTNEKNGLFFLLQHLKNEINVLKKQYPNCENTILFNLNQNPTPGLGLIVYNLINPTTSIENVLNCYDKHILVSFTSPTDPIVFPVCGYNNKGHIETYKSNLEFIKKKYLELSKQPQQTEQSTDSENQQTGQQGVKSKINELEEKLTNLNINQTILRKILDKYNIRNPSISNNIKQSLIDYIENKNIKNIPNSNLEKIVLLSINKSIFNKDEIEDQYINNPQKLFSKLEELNTYSKEINYPPTVNNYILEPSKTIGLKKVTGLVRHKYEFSDNIHKNIEVLFDELQNRPVDPIKVIKIEHNYEDNNLNRVVNYTVTLKNLTGKNKRPYQVNVKIPSLVNDRYFKINGKNYILSNQQFFVPITKTEPDECRLINSYQTLTLSIANLKINISEISKFIQYIQSRYPKKVIDVETDINKNVLRAKLYDEYNNPCEIDLTSNEAYKSKNTEFKFISDTNTWVEYKNGKETALNLGKCEYLYDRLENILHSADSNVTLKKSQKAIPYILIHLMALKLPLIIYMWQQLGLLNALSRLQIEYSISKQPNESAHFTLELQDGNYFSIFCKTRRQKLIVNGLYSIDYKKFKFKNQQELSNKHSIDDYLLEKDSRALVNLDLLTANVIDTWTRDILENDGNSTNIIDLLSVDMVDKLLNDQPNQLSDLKIYRNRQAEIIFTLLYRMLMMSHRLYSNEQKFKENAKLFLSENYVIECLLGINPHMKGSAAIEMVNPYSPITELKAAAKLIKTGPRGLPNKRMIKLQHRNIHPSYYGNVSANGTTEYADVGIVNRLCLAPLLSDKYGTYGTKDIKNINGWELLSLDEALVPFINEMQSDRAVLA